MTDRTRLIPHTSEWFAALMLQDAKQALHVMGMLDAVALADGAPRLDICSVCGDEPAPAYRLVKPKQRPSWVQTMRLCADCRQIRRDFQGETFAPL